jgi:hypothetical protein
MGYGSAQGAAAGGASSLTDLSDVTGTTGSGTVVVLQTSPSITSPNITPFLLVAFDPNEALYPASTYSVPSPGARGLWVNNAYDDTTNESKVFQKWMPEWYNGGDITVYLAFMADGITTGNVVWNVYFEAPAVDSDDLDTIAWDTAQSVTDAVPGTDGQYTVASITFTNAEADSITAGSMFRIRIERDASNGSDTAAADAQLTMVALTQE